MIVAVTGHRPDKLNDEWLMDGPCSKFVRDHLAHILESYPVKRGISGGALGVDLIWAELCLSQGIPLSLMRPFPGHNRYWDVKARVMYTNMVHNPLTEHYTICQTIGSSSYQIRNIAMVDACDLLIAVHDGSKGGTYNCLQYARKKDKPIQLIDPSEWNRA